MGDEETAPPSADGAQTAAAPAKEQEDEQMVNVVIRLTESGMSFEHAARVHVETPFLDFKDAVERLFDQRLQLSFLQRSMPRGAGRRGTSSRGTPSPSPSQLRTPGPAGPSPIRESGALTQVSPVQPPPGSAGRRSSPNEVSRIVSEAVSPKAQLVQVALDERTWPIFLNGEFPEVRAWSVFPGQTLAAVDPAKAGVERKGATKAERIRKFVEGTAGLPSEKRFALLQKRLLRMSAPPPIKGAGGRQLDLSRHLSNEQRNKRVESLWQDAERRNNAHKDREREEDERLRATMRVRVRKGRPDERSEQEEAFVARQQEALDKRQEIRDRLEGDFEERVTRIAPKGAVLGPEDIESAVARLYRSQGDAEVKSQMQEEKFHGRPVPSKRLTKEQLAQRIDSLYNGALQKKQDAIVKISADRPPPQIVYGGARLSPKKTTELVERLASKG